MLFCFAVLEVKQQADSQLAGSRTFGSQQRKSTEAKNISQMPKTHNKNLLNFQEKKK